MKHPIRFIFATLLFYTVAVYAQFVELSYATAESAVARLDLRDGFGGRAVQGVVSLSAAEGAVKCDGKAVGTSWDTTKLTDGWHTLSCNGNTERVCIRNNSSIRLEEGRIMDRITWDDDVIHVVRNDVYVPNGVTLSISEGAIVKFAEDSRIIVEHGGKIAVIGNETFPVQFAQVADDSVGGDTDLQDVEVENETATRIKCYANDGWLDNGWFIVNHIVLSMLPYLAVQPVRAMRQGGSVRIPVMVSGSRDTSFAVDWQTVDGTAKYGVDFTEKEGRVSWNSTSAGARYIEIPLVAQSQTDEDVTFTVRLVRSYGANIQTAEAVVTIYNNADSAFENLTVATAETSAIRLDIRDDFGGRIAQGVMAMSNTDGDVKLNGKAIGESWNTTKLADGWVELSQGSETRDVAIVNNAAVHCAEGRLTKNTTWNNSAVRLIRNNVYIPSGVTLTITEGTTVKFTEDTRIIVENGGKLQMNGTEDAFVQFAMATDDGYAGNTDMRNMETVLPSNSVIYNYDNGTVADNGYVASRGLVISSTYPSLTPHDMTVYENCGTVYLPVTVSGTRDSSFYAEWTAIDGTATFGEDYGLASGKLTWNSTNDGTKYIAIPITAGHLAADEETFTVRLVASGGANIQTTAVTVTIRKMNDIGLDGLTHATTVSNAARLDLREGFGGRIVRGMMDFSTTEGKVSLDGTQLPASWNSTTSNDGWYELSQNGQTADICVLNNQGIALEEGRLMQNTTWDNTVVHLIRNDIYVPSGVTLTMMSGAVVKFTEDTRIIVEHGGKVSVQGTEGSPVKFALAMDDTYGGDTDLRDGEMDVPTYSLIDCYDTDNGWEDNGCLVSRQVAFNTLPTVAIHNSRVMEHEGVVMIPVTVSGTRRDSFAVDWKATDGTAKLNRDYKASSGRLTWDSTDNGTGYIEIPLVKDDVAEDLEQFTVTLTASSGTNIDVAESTVSIVESSMTLSAEAKYSYASFEMEDAVEVDERADTFSRLARDVETLRYSTEWAGNEAAASVRVSVQLDEDNEVPQTLHVSLDGETDGTADWETSGLETGRYLLAHETLDSRGGLLDRLETNFFINREVIVHEGRLTEDETWDDSAIHVVRGNVIVPAGVQLSITSGAIVKFQNGCGIIAKLGGVLDCKGVTFTHIADDSIGGDTNLDGLTSVPSYDSYTIGGDGTVRMDSECKMYCKSATLPSGTLKQNTILSGNLVYKATGNLTIASGVTLTIEPGTVIKFDSGQGITVSSGATLEAIGTRAQPIVFTSIKDDEHGGDTNQDGWKTIPNPGDWMTIASSGSIVMDYCNIYYGGQLDGSMGDVFNMTGGAIQLSNCEIAYSLHYVAALESGSWTMTNSIVRDCYTVFRHFAQSINTNCVFYDLNYLDNNANSNLYLNNCVIMNFANDISWWAGSNHFNHCVAFNADTANGASKSLGDNGLNWADPLFNNPDNGDFTLKVNSPCIDAGDGSVAPELDYWGKPRMNNTKINDTGIAAENGCVPDIGVYECPGTGGGELPDLRVNWVKGSNSCKAGENVTVSWQVENVSDIMVSGNWRDGLYLVREDGDVTHLVELEEIVENDVLRVGEKRVYSAVVRIPMVMEGEWMYQVNVNQNRDIYEGEEGETNVGRSSETVTISLDTLVLNQKRSFSILSKGDNAWLFDGSVPEQGIIVQLTGASEDVVLVASYDSMPDAEAFECKAMTMQNGEKFMVVPCKDGQLYIYCKNHKENGLRMEIVASTIEFHTFGMDKSKLMLSEMETLTIYGTKLDSVSRICLKAVDTGSIINCTGIDYSSEMELSSTFNLFDKITGEYEVLAIKNNNEIVTVGVVAVGEPLVGPKLVVQVDIPDNIRAGRWMTATVTYSNEGDADCFAPILFLQGENMRFRDPDDGVTEYAKHIAIIGLADEGNVMMLPAGKSYTRQVAFEYMGSDRRVYIKIRGLSVGHDLIAWDSLLSATGNETLRYDALDERFGSPDGFVKRLLTIASTTQRLGKAQICASRLIKLLNSNGIGDCYVAGRLIDVSTGQPVSNYHLGIAEEEGNVFGVTTDVNGCFTGWGFTIGRKLFFGANEGQNIITKDDVFITGHETTGIQVYLQKTAEERDNSEMVVSHFQSKTDDEDNVWLFWLKNGVAHVALAESPEETEQMIDCNLCWKEMQVLSSCDGNGFDVFLTSPATSESGNDSEAKLSAQLYHVGIKLINGKIQVGDISRMDSTEHFFDIQISSFNEASHLVLWHDGLGTNNMATGLRMQLVDVSLWDEYLVDKSTRTPIEINQDLHLSKVFTLRIKGMADSKTDCCTIENSLEVGGSLKAELPSGISGGGEVSFNRMISYTCNQYWNPTPETDCYVVECDGMMNYRSRTFSGKIMAAKTWGWHSNKRRKRYLSLTASLGAELGVSYNDNVVFFPNKTSKENYSWKVTGTFYGEAKAGLTCQAWDGRKEAESFQGVTIRASASADFGYSSINGYDGDIYFHAKGQLGMLKLEWKPIYSFKTEQWSNEIPKVSFSFTSGWWDNDTRADDNSYFELDDLFIKPEKVFSSEPQTVLLANPQASSIPSLMVEEYEQENGDKNLVLGSCAISDDTEHTNVIFVREEYVNGYKEARLLCAEMDSNGIWGEVDILHDLQGEYVQGTIKTIKKSNNDIVVFYTASEPYYDGTIDDYVSSFYHRALYMVTQHNHLWGKPVKLIQASNFINEFSAVYDQEADIIHFVWTELQEKGNDNLMYAKIINDEITNSTVIMSSKEFSFSNVSINKRKSGEIQAYWMCVDESNAWIEIARFLNEEWSLRQYKMNKEEEDTVQDWTRGSHKAELSSKSSNRQTRSKNEVCAITPCNHCLSLGSSKCPCGCGQDISCGCPANCPCGGHCAKCKCGGGGEDEGNSLTSNDPNEIVGPRGTGDPSTQRFVKPGEWLDYTIYFENKSTADAAAQEIWINLDLNERLVDVSTFQLGEIAFGNQQVNSLNGKATGKFAVTQEGTPFQVRGKVTVDKDNGAVQWYLRSYDPANAEGGYWPAVVTAGILPPNDSTHRGEGYVRYKVKVRKDAPNNAFINAEATIVFDYNEPITTSPAWFNWVTTEENPVADATTLRWDTSDDADGTTYVVNYWSGDPDPTAPGTTITFNSETLTTGRWTLPDLYPDTYYWYVTKTHDDESSKTSTWSFDILASHTLTVHGGSGSGTYRTNTLLTVEANTVDGKIFAGWTADGIVLSYAELMKTQLVFTMPDNDVTLTANYRQDEQNDIELRPGWNLIAVPGDLSESDNAALFAELTAFAFDAKSKTYVQASLPLTAGEPLWIFSNKSQMIPFVYENIDTTVKGLTEESGWHLVGVGGKEDVMIGNVLAVWQWEHGKWSSVEIQDGFATLSAGCGYFVYKEKADVIIVPLGWIQRYFDGEDFHWSDDADGDGLANWEEYKYGTDPVKMDTDGDEMSDGWEVKNNRNPLDPNDIDPEMITARYLVVDLSDGPDTESYPIRYSSTGPDLNDDTCRTTELWLRRIPKGTFIMGSPEGEVGRSKGDPGLDTSFKFDETQHEVTLTQDYYIGVFECTQKQWELVMGSNPSEKLGDCRPVEIVTYGMIRGTNMKAGAGWPLYGHRVDATSFMGKLRGKTGLTFDLPTEAQWEYACRAGTATALNSGKNLTSTEQDIVMDEVGRYYSNQSDGKGGYSADMTKVGSYRPNAWGLYDMHGNAWEWCLDWHGFYDMAGVKDPVGSVFGVFRVTRGGCWYLYASDNRSACRDAAYPVIRSYAGGLRVAFHPSYRKDTISIFGGTANVDNASVGTTVTISADEPAEGMVFDKWVSDDVEVAESTEAITTFVMPAKEVTVTASYVPKTQEDTLYVVVDLSGGPNAASYSVRYTNTPPNLNDDTCRTTELWLRRVPHGAFLMGTPKNEKEYPVHEVTLTHDYYIGVFECTQRQWELVVGNSKPSRFINADYYATRPVECVSYDMIRGISPTAGEGWPEYGHLVDDYSFMGILRKKTGLVFDLPTEAQWEYACRAGTTTDYNSGKNQTTGDQDTAMDELGRYLYNGGQEYSIDCTPVNGTAKVGSYMPNAWGLYDMHGNVREWCLDWYGGAYGTEAVMDPVGGNSGDARICRGGCWNRHAGYCCSASRAGGYPYSCSSGIGFRIVCLP